MQTSAGRTIDSAGMRMALDSNVKKLFSHRAILAPLLSMCVPEFHGVDPKRIAEECFIGEPSVSRTAVHQDEQIAERDGLMDGDARIDADNSEDRSRDDGTVFYDIIFTARTPGGEGCVQLIINIEIQNDNISYDIVTRGIYYCARMLSGQRGRRFRAESYGDIIKVYSIWICPYSRSKASSINSYAIKEQRLAGDISRIKEHYDKLETIIITLHGDSMNHENELLRYLGLLFSREITSAERKQRLEDDYRIAMTRRMEEEMIGVCNLGEQLENIGVERGIDIGVERGIDIGVERGIGIGREEGRAEGENLLGALITKLINAGRSEDVKRAASDADFRSQLYKQYGLN